MTCSILWLWAINIQEEQLSNGDCDTSSPSSSGVEDGKGEDAE